MTDIGDHLTQHNVVLIRGVPGSGKTTLARTAFPTHVHMETDEFFMLGGVYRFDKDLLSEAHGCTLARFKHAMRQRVPTVVSNTFTQHWEIMQYAMVMPDGTWPLVIRCADCFENTHGVPMAKVRQMQERMEPWEGEVFVSRGKVVG